MIFADPETAPHFLKHSFKFKGLKDVVNTKSITNPIGYMKETVKTIKKSPIEGGTMLTQPLLGGGARPAAVTQFVNSKGKVPYDSNQQLSSKLIPNYVQPEAVVSLPDVPVPDAPISRMSGAVKDASQSSRLAASKRKGFLGTLFAKETGGYGGNKTLGGAGGSSILGA